MTTPGCEGHELSHVPWTFDRIGIRHPPHLVVLVATRQISRRDVGHEGEVHVQPLGAREVLLVSEKARGRSIDAEPFGGAPFEPRLLEELAARRFERRLPRFDLAADGKPLPET